MAREGAAAATSARDKIAAARVWLLREKPFFGVLARALRVEQSTRVAALRLHPDDRLEAHPDFVLALSFGALCTRLAHVALHAALGAFVRRRARAAPRWNVAHDRAIDPWLRAAGLTHECTSRAHHAHPTDGADHADGAGIANTALPPGASAEEHYERMPVASTPEPAWCDLCDPPSDASSAASPADGRDSHAAADGGAHDAGVREERSGRASSPMAHADAEARALAWRMRLAAALEEEIASGGRTFGARPGWIDELIQATLEPAQHWSAELQHVLASRARNGRTWMRPSRRAGALVAPGEPWPELVMLPGRRVDAGARLVVVLDTSGSITSARLSRFLGVIAAVTAAEGMDDVRLLQADAALQRDEVCEAAVLTITAVPVSGRGGTRYAPALLHLAAEARASGQRFTVVYLTDLEGTFPSGADVAALDVLWVVPHRARTAPPFGRVLEMREHFLEPQNENSATADLGGEGLRRSAGH